MLENIWGSKLACLEYKNHISLELSAVLSETRSSNNGIGSSPHHDHYSFSEVSNTTVRRCNNTLTCLQWRKARSGRSEVPHL
jgi:hypothetical protein